MKQVFVKAEIWPDTYLERPGGPIKSHGWKATVEIAKEEIGPVSRWYANESQTFYAEDFARVMSFIHDRWMDCQQE